MCEGSKTIDESLLKRIEKLTKKPAHHFLRRGHIIFLFFLFFLEIFFYIFFCVIRVILLSS